MDLHNTNNIQDMRCKRVCVLFVSTVVTVTMSSVAVSCGKCDTSRANSSRIFQMVKNFSYNIVSLVYVLLISFNRLNRDAKNTGNNGRSSNMLWKNVL